ncbi:hypothetical protein TUM20985_16280 [Mycobacterium antarcticum]|uniref:hypothetical protein n=1 Tax=unclassified Mycolicibacterium TaxID=2636767 RepID=UPI00239A3838|nr:MULTISPECIES: hypothetical protein [unclassified Mycolicibacterium]BDX31081.1 hypothetical protein TUM20985_16280 [Mycolicibacterium sp. TUM20985]GLP74431.1 hypothetical protein TUM20983_15410 [Mycolicibacterium sp. TUM20983]GLP80228.1 hypothetical protein TUM20984_16480 [Mycolicibacterium sp. TUM20984]
MLLAVEYGTPGPHRDLFVKFSRDFDDPDRDHGRTQMESEVRFAALSNQDDFPVAVPTVLFADFEATSGTGLLITRRIPFGYGGIEPQYAKCMDYDLPDQVGHYQALLGALGRLAGTHLTGGLPNALRADMEALSVGARPTLSAATLDRRVDRLAEFASAHPGLLPANVRSPAFLARLRGEIPLLSDAEGDVWQSMRAQTDLVGLCHWNANVDNAWFWRDDEGTLQCGLMDWGCAGQMHAAMAIWGAMSGAETDMWDDGLDGLLDHFAAEFHACGGGIVDADVLKSSVVLYAAVMGMTWLLDVPAYVRSRTPGLTAASTRMDAGIRDVESVRCRLQMLTNVLNLWQRNDIGRLLTAL